MKSKILLVIGGILVGVGGRGVIEEIIKASETMPPGYFLQTDGHYWRWYALERSGWWTNETTFDCRSDAFKNANNVARINSHAHEWKDHP